jgi:hypothetical protein
MAEEKIIGTAQPLGRTVVDPPTHTSKQGQAQTIGDALPLSRNVTLPPTHTSKQGTVQVVGSGVDLSRNPQKPWSQANLPTSTMPNMAPTGGKK